MFLHSGIHSHAIVRDGPWSHGVLASHIGIGPDGDLQTLDSDVPRVSWPSEDMGESASSGREQSETEKRVANFWASLTTRSNSRTMQMPAVIFPPDKPGMWQQMLKEYSQINVYEPEGLRNWQLQTIDEKELLEYEQNVVQTMLSTNVDEKDIDFSDFYIIQEAFAGSSDPTESPNIVDSRPSLNAVKAASERLRTEATSGGILSDDIGTGTTYVFNKKDERASKTVLLVPYQTFSDRSMETLDTRANMFMESEGLKKWSTKLRKVVLRNFEQRYQGHFSAVFCDEGHRIRHENTGVHQCVSLLDAPINWIITATPEVNSALHGNNKKPWFVFKEVQSLPDGDPLRLLPVQPDHFKALILDLAEIANYSGYMRKLVFLKRTTASSLVWDSSPSSAHVSLKNVMPKHEVETIKIGYTRMEAPEAQALHRTYAHIYEETMDDWVKEQWKRNSGRGGKLDDDAPRLVRVRRALLIVSASTLLSKTYVTCALRSAAGDFPVGDRHKDIAYLCFGGPKLRTLLRQDRETVLNATRPRELLVIDETPLVAWLEEMLLQHMHIDAHVFHADLDTAERDALVEGFNDLNRSPQVLILLYNIASQGVNMHKACSDALVTSSGINASAEVQAWGRLIRIAQKDTAHVVRCQVLKSYDQFRDSKQRDKQKLILALTTPSPAMKVLLVNLLNAANVEVKALHDSNLTSLFRNKREKAVLALRDDVQDDNNLSNHGLEDEYTLAGKSVSDVRRALRKDCEKRESFNPDLFALAIQLRLEPKRVYTEEDLNDNAVYGRALGLLLRIKFGQKTENFRLSPIIRYDALAPEILRAIEAQVEAFYRNSGLALEQQNDDNEVPVSAEQVVRKTFSQTAEMSNGDGDANSPNQEPGESQDIRAWEAFWDVEMTDGDGTTHPGPGEDQEPRRVHVRRVSTGTAHQELNQRYEFPMTTQDLPNAQSDRRVEENSTGPQQQTSHTPSPYSSTTGNVVITGHEGQGREPPTRNASPGGNMRAMRDFDEMTPNPTNLEAIRRMRKFLDEREADLLAEDQDVAVHQTIKDQPDVVRGAHSISKDGTAAAHEAPMDTSVGVLALEGSVGGGYCGKVRSSCRPQHPNTPVPMTYSPAETRELLKTLQTYKSGRSSPMVKTEDDVDIDMAAPSIETLDRIITLMGSDDVGSHGSKRSASPVVKTEDDADIDMAPPQHQPLPDALAP
ncbi:hypothetical protein IWX90DRAFT_500523 [Phyllosticta citrichinensis]|uniref:Helicase C-terminal domain-containing protein n=1 Tax=Phyllosticta citrichinensis TaxID=1130410 RepID=A0ABR1Y0Q2_9PEZI